MTDKSNAFTEWLDALEIPTEQVLICSDPKLVARAVELHEVVQAAKADGAQDTAGRSLADEDPASEAEVELAQVRALIETKSRPMTFQSPSEDDMLSIAPLHKDDTDLWVASVIAFASVEPKMTVDDVKLLRKRLDRGTWARLFDRVLDIAVNRSLSLPFSWGDSGSSQN